MMVVVVVLWAVAGFGDFVVVFVVVMVVVVLVMVVVVRVVVGGFGG